MTFDDCSPRSAPLHFFGAGMRRLALPACLFYVRSCNTDCPLCPHPQFRRPHDSCKSLCFFLCLQVAYGVTPSMDNILGVLQL